MLDHFHGLQYTEEHQSFYEVSMHVPDYLAYEIASLFGHYRVSMCKKIWLKER
jgi:hypothetical protein